MSRKVVPLLVVAALGAAWALCVPRGDPLAAQTATPGPQKMPRLLAAPLKSGWASSARPCKPLMLRMRSFMCSGSAVESMICASV